MKNSNIALPYYLLLPALLLLLSRLSFQYQYHSFCSLYIQIIYFLINNQYE